MHLRRQSMRVIALLLLCTLTRVAAAADAPASSDLYGTLVTAYLDGKWEEADQTLSTKSKELAALTDPKQKADVAYLRQAVAEGRPPWWKTCKARAAHHI